MLTAEVIPAPRSLTIAGPAAPAPALAARSEAASLMEVIGRAAADPSTDVDKLERLMAMYERITALGAKAQFDAALAAMQPELPVINERGRIEIKKKDTEQVIQSTKYALWEDINEAISPILDRHGFALSFRTGVASDGKLTVTGILSHAGGHREETTLFLPHDSTGSKNAVQAVGSTTSYGKRYAAMALLNITSRGEDDDGKKGGDPGGLNEEQLGKLTEFMDSVGADREKFLRYFKIDTLAHLPPARFDEAMRLLQDKARRG